MQTSAAQSRKWTIASKLFTSFGAIIFASLTTGIVTFVCISHINGDIDRIVNESGRSRMTSSRIQTDLAELISQMRGMEVRALLKDQASVDRYDEAYRADLVKLHDHIAYMEPAVKTDQGRKFMALMKEAESRLGELGELEYKKISSGDSAGGITAFTSDFLPYAKTLQVQAEEFIGFTTTVMEASVTAAHTSEAEAEEWTAAVLVVCLCVGGVIFYVVRGINVDLRSTASSLSEGASQIASAAAEMTASSQAVAQGASEQAAFIEETSASTEEVNAMTRRNTESSQTTATIVSDSQVRFAETNRSLEEMIAAMEGISTSSEQISRIIKVIDQIAFQTNILALNAAVEAARAGEAGAGFAVVADEVRNLAHRSAQAAQDTSTLIEESIAKSQDGRVKVDQVAQAIRSITGDSAQVKVLVDEIKTGSMEQSRGVEQISKAIQKMEKITQSNAASAEESAASASELTAQSKSVREVVDYLASLVGGVQTTPVITSVPRRTVQRAPVKLNPGPKRADDAAPPMRTEAAAEGESSFLDF